MTTVTPEISAYFSAIAKRNAGKKRNCSPELSARRREHIARQRAKHARGQWVDMDGAPYTGPVARLNLAAGKTGVYQLSETDCLVTFRKDV